MQRVPGSAFTIFLQGDRAVASVAFGDGARCVGGNLKRLYVTAAQDGITFAPGAGDPRISARSAALGDPIAPGSMRYYQAYYRDPSPTFCNAPQGDTFNATNARAIVW